MSTSLVTIGTQGDTLCAVDAPIVLEKMDFPEPVIKASTLGDGREWQAPTPSRVGVISEVVLA